jgi:hypothetical protein
MLGVKREKRAWQRINKAAKGERYSIKYVHRTFVAPMQRATGILTNGLVQLADSVAKATPAIEALNKAIEQVKESHRNVNIE